VIPIGAWITAAIVFGLGFLVANFIRDNPPFAFAFLLIPLISLFLSGYILLVGYVYGDARRRGMRYVMWTLLAIFLANGIGIVLYFILREPLLGYCSRCGSGVQHGFAYCPRCGANLRPRRPTRLVALRLVRSQFRPPSASTTRIVNQQLT
jgi:hypothetical protein